MADSRIVSILLFAALYCCAKAEIASEVIEYFDGQQLLKGFVARSDAFGSRRPVILVLPDWNGRDDYENNMAIQLAQLGYIGFAVDVYGNGTIGNSPTENSALIGPFIKNRPMLLQRLTASLNKAKSLPNGDPYQISAIGYCFGGLGVLDLARNNLGLNGVVSFHGNLSPLPGQTNSNPISTKVLVQTGYDDSSIPPEQVLSFEQEMKSRSANFQVTTFSDTLHGFTVPGPNYNALSDKRSWQAMKNFFEEIYPTK